MKNINRQKGFSLVEMIIYISILAMMVLVLVSSLRTVVVSYRQIKVQRTIETSAYLAMERLTKELKNGSEIDLAGSSFDSASSSITFINISPTQASKTTRIYLDQGILKISENDVPKGQLTASSTTVTDFTLTRILGAETEGVKIELTLQAGRGDNLRQETFYSTAVLRGTY